VNISFIGKSIPRKKFVPENKIADLSSGKPFKNRRIILPLPFFPLQIPNSGAKLGILKIDLFFIS
jgi:hypothetical protein